ncbi:MAG TPA: serine hydrolase domain-containing protein, partial [Candidatus Eisenbacteria bacterium]|nr:serine hydrolase domain-containing protein [Candidatus Eisenbacteria bacterium]
RAEERAGFSGAVLIARGNSILFERAYGTARASAPPAFWLASDSKQFTATAIMRLEETGRLRTSDSLGRFFRRVPRDKAAITIHQLLTHTSGLPHAYRADGITDRDRAVEAILGLGLRGAPGAAYSYSNDGYTLLAAIVEIASGVPFDDFLADSLFARAGLAHTGLWGREDPRTPIAPLADPRRTRGVRPTIWRDGHSVANWGYRGCTGAWATPGDVLAWLRALRSGRVIAPASLAKQLGRHVLVRDDSTGQAYTGYGWSVRVEGGRDVSYGHTGSEDWLGHTSVIRWTPAGEVVVVLGNSGETDGTGWATRVNRGLRRLPEVATGAPP